MDSQGCCAPVSLQPLCFSTVDEPTKTHHIVTRSRSEDHTWKEIGRESSPRLQDPPYFTKRSPFQAEIHKRLTRAQQKASHKCILVLPCSAVQPSPSEPCSLAFLLVNFFSSDCYSVWFGALHNYYTYMILCFNLCWFVSF